LLVGKNKSLKSLLKRNSLLTIFGPSSTISSLPLTLLLYLSLKRIHGLFASSPIVATLSQTSAQFLGTNDSIWPVKTFVLNYFIDSEGLHLKTRSHTTLAYHGFYGGTTAGNASLVLPGETFLERKNLYFGTPDGRIVHDLFVAPSPYGARDQIGVIRLLTHFFSPYNKKIINNFPVKFSRHFSEPFIYTITKSLYIDYAEELDNSGVNPFQSTILMRNSFLLSLAARRMLKTSQKKPQRLGKFSKYMYMSPRLHHRFIRAVRKSKLCHSVRYKRRLALTIKRKRRPKVIRTFADYID